ncbi:hypothetical protein D9V84_10240 [Bacteroidetes/Chlorobi group bacterium Naka2016]|nr:MAG: hypothetical protein D9V84_10240 [Bacteroidetes/Chlorobi group bacterium Naka2016]
MNLYSNHFLRIEVLCRCKANPSYCYIASDIFPCNVVHSKHRKPVFIFYKRINTKVVTKVSKREKNIFEKKKHFKFQ